MMLQVSQQFADKVYLTSDNPRSESPTAIIDDAMCAFDEQLAEVVVEPDRQRAIESAIASASSEDIVLIAGKGHETYQEIKGVRQHFDDREEALKALSKYVN